MKIIIIFLMFLLHYYLVTFAVYNWKNKNKRSVFGTILLIATTLAMQILLFFTDV